MDELHELMLDQLRDAHSAEKQAIQGMKRLQRKASDAQLRQGIEAHIAQSEEHRERVERALEMMDGKPGRKVCEAMRGLVEEAQHSAEEHDKGPLLDIVIVASLQRVEHYEIAAYGTIVELARAFEHDDVADLLEQTLNEEKEMDRQLTEVSRDAIIPAALEVGEEDEGDDEDDNDEDREDEDAAGGEDEEADVGGQRREPTRGAAGRQPSSAKRSAGAGGSDADRRAGGGQGQGSAPRKRA